MEPSAGSSADSARLDDSASLASARAQATVSAAATSPVQSGDASGVAGLQAPADPVASLDGSAISSTPAGPGTSGTVTSAGQAAPSSLATATEPAGERAATDDQASLAGRWLRRRRGSTSRMAQPMTSKKAGVLLTVLGVLALGCAGTTATLADRALSAAGAGASASAPLIMPAPAQAAGFPRRYLSSASQSALLAIAQFRRRFAALRGGSTAAYPAALYAEPGRIDLASDTGAWVIYLGYNAPAGLGDPAGTTGRLMARLAGPTPARSWQVPAGSQGGAARCMIAMFGLTRMSVCGWATEDTVAAVMSPAGDTSADELAALIPAMRLDLQPG